MNTEQESSVVNDNVSYALTMRLCTECYEPIPAIRLQAKPDATMCVKCLERNGDVFLVKRHDEYVGEELVSSFFAHDAYIDTKCSGRFNYNGLGKFSDAFFLVEDEQPVEIKSLYDILTTEDELIDSMEIVH